MKLKNIALKVVPAIALTFAGSSALAQTSVNNVGNVVSGLITANITVTDVVDIDDINVDVDVQNVLNDNEIRVLNNVLNNNNILNNVLNDNQVVVAVLSNGTIVTRTLQ